MAHIAQQKTVRIRFRMNPDVTRMFGKFLQKGLDRNEIVNEVLQQYFVSNPLVSFRNSKGK